MSIPPDDSLPRLLRAAARRDPSAEASPSPRLIRQVMADWRASAEGEPDPASALFAKWAVLSTSALAALLLLLNLSTLTSIQRANGWRAADLQLMDSALQMQIP